MKSIDVIQPLPMQTAIAESGSKDTIPQNQADTEQNWYCSIEKGFPDITMKALADGGRPPRGQGANGLFYLSTDQRLFLQNGGIITFNASVSSAIGGYPQGAVLALKQDGAINWLESQIDDNTYNFVENNAYIGTYWKALSPKVLNTAEGVPDVIITGEPIIDEGVVSGFSASNYLQYPIIFDPQSFWWSINLCFTTGADITTEQYILCGYYNIKLAVINGKTSLSLSSTGYSWDIANDNSGSINLAANTTYYVNILFDGVNQYQVSFIDKSTSQSTLDHIIFNSNIISPNVLYLGNSYYTSAPFSGSINLNKCSVYINGSEIWNGMDAPGLATKANIDLSNLSAEGIAMLNNKFALKADVDLLNSVPTSTFANKLDNADIRTVIETWQSSDGTLWYRIYSDKWCEQGGFLGTSTFNTKTVNLIKAYKDTNIYLVTGLYNSTDASAIRGEIVNKSTLSFIRSGTKNVTGWYETKGYIN